jgi:hypothetical protein
MSGGGRTFHFGIDIAAPAGTRVYAVVAGKVSFGAPSDVAQNGGIVVVEADGRNFGYWHVAPMVTPGTHVPQHGLLGHIADRPEDWGHVHFAESTHGPNGITYWNPIRAGALTPFKDYGPPVIDAIITSLPPTHLHGFVDLSVKAHDNTPIPVTQAQPPGWHGLPVTPARIRWRLTRGTKAAVPWSTAFDHGRSIHPQVKGNPPTDAKFADVYAPDTTQNNPNAPGIYHFWLKRQFDSRHLPNGSYRLEVEATDVRCNARNATLALTIKN